MSDKLIAWLREHCSDIRGDVAADRIEQLTARVRELEEEKKELQALLDFDNARLDQIEDELEDVEYLGPFVEGIKVLKTQLAAAQEEIKTVTEQKNRMWFEMQTAQNQLAKAEQRVAEYNELIYAVQTKNPDETRHQTALRYIRNAENRPSNAVANGASI